MAHPATVESSPEAVDRGTGFVRELGLFDSTMVVAGAMIGSGIFIVSADIGRLVGSSGWLLATWLITGFLTLAGALSYGELAANAGKPGATRAVGNTMARNRFPIVIPCHRVVGAGGGLGGFSAPSGISLKEKLLSLEGSRPRRRGRPR